VNEALLTRAAARQASGPAMTTLGLVCSGPTLIYIAGALIRRVIDACAAGMPAALSSRFTTGGTVSNSGG
jgi:hypothetical protein